MLLQDRLRVFEEQTSRIEAQLAILERDTAVPAEEASPAGRRLRARSLESTRQLMIVHLNNARKFCGRTPTLAGFQDYLVAVTVPTIGQGAAHSEVPSVSVNERDAAAAPINLERIADALYLYDEIRQRLKGVAGAGKKDAGSEEGVA